MSSKSQPHFLSPENYLKNRARLLPLGECYINAKWKEGGMASIIVTRRHITGFLTFALYQVDLYCLGVKNASWRFNESPAELEDIIDKQIVFSPDDSFIKTEYTLVHNIIYGALEYAEDLGFRPHKDFNLAQYILEEDDDRIELVDIEFGLDGKPAIFIGKETYPPGVISILQRSVGPGNFHIFTEDQKGYHDADNEDDNEDDLFDEYKDSYQDDLKSGHLKPMNQDMVNLSQERLMKYLGEQNFSSEEELKAFLDKNVTGKKIDEILPVENSPKTNTEKADDLMYEAYQLDSRKGINLAKEVLKLDPENVRALNFLAQNEPDPVKAETLLDKSIMLAEKQLGKDYFKENRGNFWFIAQTRPYMTAKFGMACCKEALEKDDEAIKIYQEMIKLNPNDNQGARYELARLLLKHYNLTVFHKLHKKYKKEESAHWLFNYTYFAFLIYGAGKLADDALIKAYHANVHVVKIMAGEESLPKNLGEYYSPGSFEEAAYYLMDNLELWTRDLNVIKWVGRVYKKLKNK
jgi:hypothetical protein